MPNPYIHGYGSIKRRMLRLKSAVASLSPMIGARTEAISINF